MTAILNVILKILPFLAPMFNKPNDAEAERKRHEKELKELEVFASGRITPKFLLKYALVVAFSIFILLAIFSMFFPEAISSPGLDKIRELIEAGKGLE